MFKHEDILSGVKLTPRESTKEPPKEDAPSPTNIWDRITHLEKGHRCLNCQRHKWKNKEVKLCQDCYKTCPREKCIHCREEFSNHKYCKKAETTYNRLVCLNCARNIATYNSDPRLCRYCSCWSAWRQTSECDRCFRLLEKYGNPSNCESCSRNCAFDRGEESRNKVSGLKLCFLCTYDFKKNEYYLRRRLGLNNDRSDHSPTNHNSKSSNSTDPEKEFLRKRVAELEAELALLRSSQPQPQPQPDQP